MVNLSFSWLAFAALLFCWSLHSVNCQQASSAAQVDRSSQMIHDLYATIRAIAFPKSPELVEYETNVDNRFVLMLPGKILNYFDYFPGQDYTKFIQNPSKNKKFEVVPPHVMEKWFDLADAVPTANPYNGQDSGRSLANIYKSILKDLVVTNIKDQGELVLSLYNAALDYLNEVVYHPENLTREVTRLSLYDEYKEMYNDRRLEMEDKIEVKRKSLQYLDYELWFQRHYPPLLSKVESAYTRWLIFGQKELCDIYISILNTGTSAKQLEEARIVMRSAGVVSLDRTRTIYPVSFEPSDWYKYLIPKIEKPTRAEIQHLLGEIQSEIDYLTYEIDFYRKPNTKLDGYKGALEAKSTQQSSVRDSATSMYAQKQLDCSAQNMGIATSGDSCAALSNSSNSLTKALDGSADSIANKGDYKWTQKEAHIEQLNNSRAELERLRQIVQGSVGGIDPFGGSLTQSDPDLIETVIDSQRENQWLSFEFDSEEYQSQKTYNTYSRSARVSGRASLFWSNIGRGSGGGGIYATDLQKEMSKATLKAKGKLLRVHIKRPWFKPSVFDDRNLEFVTNTDGYQLTLGAPGSHLTEADFINAMTGGDGPDDILYRLPEYTTSFLLAKDIELEISNVQENFVRTVLHISGQANGNVNVFFFKVGGSYSGSSTAARSRFYRTANGMKIKIPGAQVIGYYTQKLPKFPI